MTGSTQSTASSPGDAQSGAITFLLGAVLGGFAGAFFGMLLGRKSLDAASAVINAFDKRAGRSRDRPRFELLLQ